MADRANVTIVISDLGVGGAQRVAVNLANYLAGSGRKVSMVTIDGTEHDYFVLDERISRNALNLKQPSSSPVESVWRNFARIFRLRQAIKRTECDVVVSFLAKVNVLVVIATRFMGMQVIISERNDPAQECLGTVWERLRRSIYPRADVVTANSDGALSVLSRYVPEEKLKYVPNILSEGEVKAATGSREKNILAVGRLEKQKAYDVLLRAFSLLRSGCADWRLTIVGKGSQEKQLKQLARDLNIGDDRLTWISEADPVVFYETSSIFVLPSRYEGTPNVLLEAIAHGLPVVVTDASPGPLQYIVHEQTGLVVPVDSAEALANSIERLALDSRLRLYLSRNAKVKLEKDRVALAADIWDQVLAIDATA